MADTTDVAIDISEQRPLAPADLSPKPSVVEHDTSDGEDSKDHEQQPFVTSNHKTNKNNNNYKDANGTKSTELGVNPSRSTITTIDTRPTSIDSSVTVATTPLPKVDRQLSVLSMGGYEKVETGVSLTWKNLTYKVNDGKKTILNNVSGYVGPGNVLVILGPSGSGKTSLLSILSGNRVHTSGDIHYQGRKKVVTKRSEDIMGFHGNASYVAQDDALMGSLTVKETLKYAARLKISDNEVDKDTQVDAIIKYLGLEVCQDTLVGSPFVKGISGGQKRRLSIGIELVTQPGLLFLDEVTSGLDATSAYHLLRLISKLAKLGHSIIMTLHQPTSRLFKLMCDANYYMLILESGNESYFGYAKDSIEYFKSLGYTVPPFNNATDYFLDLVNRDFESSTSKIQDNNTKHKTVIKEKAGEINNVVTAVSMETISTADIINEAFKVQRLELILNEINNINNEFKLNPLPILKSNNFFKQFFILLEKNSFNLLRNPGIFWLRLVMYSGLCLALGTLYFNIDNKEDDTQDRINLLFFCLSFFTFMSVSAMPAFVEERAFYMRERMNNHYSTISYVLANFFSSIPWVFLLALVCSAIIYLLVQLRWGWDYYGIFLLDFFVVLMVAENMMIAISALSSLFMVGLAMGSGLLGLYMTLGGFVIKAENIPPGWKWAYYGISFHTYSFEIFMYNDLHDNNNVDIVNGENTFNGNRGNEVLKEYGMADVDIAFDFLILCIMMIVYRIIFYFLLKFLHRRQK